MSLDIKKSNTLCVARYSRSAKGKATRAAYKASPRGLAVQKASYKTYPKKKRDLLAALKRNHGTAVAAGRAKKKADISKGIG